jgi:type IV pilus assembly protein PilB
MDAGLLTETQLRTALSEQRKWGGRLGITLVQMGYVDENSMVHALSRQLAIPTVDLETQAPNAAALQALRLDIAERYTVFPVAYEAGTKTLTVATPDPTNVESLQELAFHSGQKIQVVVASASSIERAIRHHYRGEVTSTAATPLQFGMEEETFELSPSREPEAPAPAPRPARDAELVARVDALTQQVADLERMVAQQARVMRAMMDALEDRGALTREEVQAKAR